MNAPFYRADGKAVTGGGGRKLYGLEDVGSHELASDIAKHLNIAFESGEQIAKGVMRKALGLSS